MDIFSKGIHRLAITGADGQLMGVLTQSNVANFLYPKLITSPIGHKTVITNHSASFIVIITAINTNFQLKELELGKTKVVSISSDAQVFAAMTLMHDHGLSSVPLVDHAGHLVGSISLSDVCCLYLIKRKVIIYYFHRLNMS
jgi:CBS domain-containing protein